jgi:endo-1,4-beta-xylanase
MTLPRRLFASCAVVTPIAPVLSPLLAACGGGAASVNAAQATTPTPATPAPVARPTPAAGTAVASLAQAFLGRLAVGSAVTPAQLRDPAIAEFIRHHFNQLVAENVMKQEALAPRAEGAYTWTEADEVVNFAQKHGMKLRGHTLIWHVQTPAWMFKAGAAEVSREVLIARMERYITDVVSHFKGKVYAWDVVNEAFVFDEANTPADAQGMRMSEWRRIIGPEYIEIAFRAAAKADPDALLFYNDYETQSPKKVAAMLNVVKDLRAKGVKIDGIGHQMHCGLAWPLVADVRSAIDTLAAQGLQQHITELDIALNKTVTEALVTAATPELLAAQAQRYRAFFELFLNRRSKVQAVLVWGIGDAYTWLTSWPVKRFEAPLLFDAQLQPKPAYHALIELSKA